MRNRIYGIFSFFVFVCMASSSMASQMSEEAYFAKISRRLRGVNPSESEFSELARAQVEGVVSAFIAQKVSEFQKSPDYADQLEFHLSELFRVRSSVINNEEFPINGQDHSRNSPLQELFRSIARDDLSWDALLLTDKYSLRRVDKYYYENLLTSLESGPDKEIEDLYNYANGLDQNSKVISFPNDARTAGSLTTPDFNSRYVNTAINRGRQRAAAVFRIFMCDDMVAAIPTVASKRAEFFKLFTNASRSVVSDEKIHGDQKDCKTCHRKLDPLGKVFQASRLAIGPEASPGALVFDNDEGHEVSVKVGSIREMGAAITRTEAYARCQVRHFWNWYIGKDYPLVSEGARENQLVAQFNSHQRRANEFIAYLMRQPEFINSPPIKPEGQVWFYQVQPLLKRCDSCHSDINRVLPRFSILPFGGDLKSHAKWTELVEKSLHLTEGKYAMPRQKEAWREQDLNLLKTWLQQGAKDDQGRLTRGAL